MLLEQAKRQRISLRAAVRLDSEDATRRRKHEMAVQLGGGMRSEHYPVLLGELGYAQGLGKAGGAGGVELHKTDAAFDNEIAHREAGQLAFAMRKRDRRRC